MASKFDYTPSKHEVLYLGHTWSNRVQTRHVRQEFRPDDTWWLKITVCLEMSCFLNVLHLDVFLLIHWPQPCQTVSNGSQDIDNVGIRLLWLFVKRHITGVALKFINSLCELNCCNFSVHGSITLKLHLCNNSPPPPCRHWYGFKEWAWQNNWLAPPKEQPQHYDWPTSTKNDRNVCLLMTNKKVSWIDMLNQTGIPPFWLWWPFCFDGIKVWLHAIKTWGSLWNACARAR